MIPQSLRDHEQRLDEVLARYLRALKDGSAPDRREWLENHAELADELSAFFADQDSFERLAAPLRGLLPAKPSQVRDFGDYEVLAEVARGGMGVVYKARQKSLGRVVALKMLLAGPWASDADLRRFRTEAEAAAHLDHPNILPIYEVGTHDGHPYLSMKFVEGGSLAHRLATAGRRPEPRETARLMATLADAVHYAHQRGVLHRDLKPANILLAAQKSETGTRDETTISTPIIADFGLAKRAALSEPAVGRAPGDSSSLPTLPQPPVCTHTGALIGTPSYMAPEQASGSPGGVTTAADVYGLGAILYEMLTGRPPFKGATPLDTVRQVLEREPARPGAIDPSVNRDLETICLKCLRKEPARRYASARELADDLRRFLNGEPILARPVGPLGRAWRRARRHPVSAALALALVLVVLSGTSAVTVLWLRAEDSARRVEQHFRTAEEERDKARAALEQAEKSRQEAEEHLEDAERSFRLAHQAVHDYCRRVSDELQDVPYLQKLRRSLLADALAYYKSFLIRRGNDPALRRELADTYSRMARLNVTIGARTDARSAFGEAVKLYRQLLEADPDSLSIQRQLGDALNGLAILEDSTEASLAGLHEASSAYRRFLEARPDEMSLRAGLAIALSNMGLANRRMGRFAESAGCFREALALLEQMVEKHPKNEGLRADLASALGNYAGLCNQEPQGRETALQALRRVLELRSGLARSRPRDAGRQADLAAAHQDLAISLRDAGQQKEALDEFQKAHDIRAKLSRDNPSMPRYQLDLASSLIDLGAFHHHQNRLPQALDCFQKSSDILEEQFHRHADSPFLRFRLGQSWFRVAIIQGALGHRPEEHQALVRARELQTALIALDPGNLDYRRDLSRTLNNLGQNRMARKHPEEAVPLAREALGHMRLVLERAPRVPAYRQTIAFNWSTLAEAEKRLGHTRAAAAALRERVKLGPDDPRELFRTAHDLMLVAQRVGPDDEEERRGYHAESLDLLRQAVAHGFRDVARLQEDKALESLRSEEGYRELVRRMENQER